MCLKCAKIFFPNFLPNLNLFDYIVVFDGLAVITKNNSNIKIIFSLLISQSVKLLFKNDFHERLLPRIKAHTFRVCKN